MVVARPLPDLPGVYYSTIFGTGLGNPSNNVFTFRTLSAPPSGTTDVATAVSVANAIKVRWGTLVANEFPTDYHVNEIKTYALHTPLAPAVVVPDSTPGLIPAPTGPIMVGAVVKHDVVRRGKGSQSRTTISPIPESGIAADRKTLTTSYQASLDAGFTAFINGVLADLLTSTSLTFEYVQLSKGTPATGPIVVPPATYVISGSHVESKLSTQRRRAQR